MKADKISTKLFEAAMGDFFDSYGAKFSPATNPLNYSAWYEYLSLYLTESELIPCLQNALMTFEFRPSPKQVVEAFKGSTEAIALEEWQTCLNAAKTGNTRNVLLSPQGEKALSSLGGFGRLEQEDPIKLATFVTKEFISRWILYEKAIASGLVAPPPKMLSPNEDKGWSKEEDSYPASPDDWKLFREKFERLLGRGQND